MLVALTHDAPPPGLVASPPDVAAIARCLEELGLRPLLVPVDPSAAGVRAAALALLTAQPGLVLNLALGPDDGFPAALEALALPLVGSGQGATLLRDRHRSRLAVWGHGISTARWSLLDDPERPRSPAPGEPVELSARFRGTGARFQVQAGGNLAAAAHAALLAHPAGVLIEAIGPGREIQAFALEGAGDILLPHGLPEETAARARRLVRRSMEALALRDWAELRLLLDGDRVRFLDAQAIPALGKDSALCRAVGGLDRVISSLITAACRRLALAPPAPAPAAGSQAADPSAAGSQTTVPPAAGSLAEELEAEAQTASPPAVASLDAGTPGTDSAAAAGQNAGPAAGAGRLRVALVYNAKRLVARSEDDDDSEAEFDGPGTVSAVAAAIEANGYAVETIEAGPDLVQQMIARHPDLVFNIAEGRRGRDREAQVPGLLDLLGIPYTGSSPLALALTLDKGRAKRVVRDEGVKTADFFLMARGDEPLPSWVRFPLIVKPVAEGSSKGVLRTSVVQDESELRSVARRVIEKYGHEALVERFLPGREFTVALLGEQGELALPPMEIVFTSNRGPQVYTFEHKLQFHEAIRYEVPARVEAALQGELLRVARASFRALGCRDVARIDLRLDERGEVNFIECNPLPGLTPGWSDLCMIATSVGLRYEELIGAILEPALSRRRAAGDRS
jgi:D-alanine-D-alanine ligase